MVTTAVVRAGTEQRSNERVEVALRVVVFAAIAWTAVRDEPWRFAALPGVLRFGVPGPDVPVVAPWLVLATTVALVGCCGYAAVGRRWAAVAVLPLGWLVLGVPQMYGKVNHYHHLLWLAVLYPVMPARKVLQWAWPVMGVVYLFPGLAKLAAAGVLLDGGMARIIQAQQWVTGWDSPVPVGGLLAQVSAVGTILFEVGFVFAAFTRWRRGFAIAGLGFHVGVFVVMGIAFWPAAVVLAVLCFDRSEPALDWQPVAVVVLAGAVVAGVAGSQGWPFAPYPPFDRAPTQRAVLEVRDAHGDPVEWLAWMPAARHNGLGSRILAEPDRCGAIVPAGGSCWRIVGLITPEGVITIAEEPITAGGRSR